MEKNRKAPARSKAKVEYLLTTKLFCGHCKEMMTGFSGTGKLGVVYNYYVCNGKKKKLCDKKMVKKTYIEDIVVKECRKLLTDTNIDKITKEVIALYKKGIDDSKIKMLKKQLTDNERRHKNILEAIMDCDDRELRQTFFAQVSKLEEEHKNIEKDIAIEEKTMPSMITTAQVKFFLNGLKKGDVNDITYRRMLINVFVNAIYLYDDRLTIIFNSGDTPVTVNDKLLSEIEESSENVEEGKGLFLDKSNPLKSKIINQNGLLFYFFSLQT